MTNTRNTIIIAIFTLLAITHTHPALAICGGWIRDQNRCTTTDGTTIPNATRCDITVAGSETGLNGPIELCCNPGSECSPKNADVPSSVTTPSVGINVNYSELNGIIGTTIPIGSTSITTIISRILPFILIMGGLLLLLMIIASGFQMLTNPTNPDAQAGGKQRLTWAVVGFFALFGSYWLAQIMEIIFNINIV